MLRALYPLPAPRMDTPMKNLSTLRLSSLAGVCAMLALPAMPVLAQQEPAYAYGGLSLGSSRAKIDEARITAGLLSGGLTTSAMSRDEKDTAWRLFGGWQFNRNIALEAGVFSLGRFGFSSTTVPAGTLSGDITLRGLNLDLVGTLPLSERWSLLGRVGAQMTRATDRFSGTGAVSVLNPNPSKRETNVKFGGGIQYELNRSFLLRAEAERYRINDAVGNHGTVNAVLLSAVFPFGRAEAPRPRMAMAPAYVPPAPAPAPVPLPPVAKAPEPVVLAPPPPPPPVVVPSPERRRVSFSADSLFSFDRAEVRPEGKVALDAFAKQLVGTRYDVIVVEGHTDRLGSSVYNQRLSVKRAEAVKAYLLSAGGIESARISAVGKGETTPVTKAADCKGSHQTAKLVSCLQPDRRVEVEVTGTR